MNLSNEQEVAADLIFQWRDNFPAGRQTFMLAGFAGTGKTTLCTEVIKQLPRPMVCAPTGKAAQVLRDKGVEATTIHTLIYEERKGVRVRVPHLAGKTIVVDEASMVSLQLLKDLCAFSLPVLFVGDGGQLEPIGPNPQIMKRPTFALTEIHRQALDNPIIRLSKAWREERPVPYWEDPKGRLSLQPLRCFNEHIHAGHQIICGFNKTRMRINDEIRKKQKRSRRPEPGERIIILQNNTHFGVFNGQIVTIRKNYGDRDGLYDLEVETDDRMRFSAPFVSKQFGEAKTLAVRPKKILLADWAHALTAHKVQGSEFYSVLVKEEIHSDWNQACWRYTTTTRAKQRLIYCG